jgi:hypothetical protein
VYRVYPATEGVWFDLLRALERAQTLLPIELDELSLLRRLQHAEGELSKVCPVVYWQRIQPRSSEVRRLDAFAIDCLEWYRSSFPGYTEETHVKFAATTEVFHFVSIDLVDPGMGSEVAVFGDRSSEFWCPLFGTGAWTARCELAARLGIAAE